jgi:hypothetical protein
MTEQFLRSLDIGGSMSHTPFGFLGTTRLSAPHPWSLGLLPRHNEFQVVSCQPRGVVSTSDFYGPFKM